jgi:hypothetical protein
MKPTTSLFASVTAGLLGAALLQPASNVIGTGDARPIFFQVDGKRYVLLDTDGALKVNPAQAGGSIIATSATTATSATSATTAAVATALGQASGTGSWTNVTYSAGNFTATESQTWTVEEADVIANRYTVIGSVMIWQLSVDDTTVGGTPSFGLVAKIPGGFTAPTDSADVMWISNDGTFAVGAYRITNVPTTTVINYLTSGGSWAAATNTTRVNATYVFRITP